MIVIEKKTNERIIHTLFAFESIGIGLVGVVVGLIIVVGSVLSGVVSVASVVVSVVSVVVSVVSVVVSASRTHSGSSLPEFIKCKYSIARIVSVSRKARISI